MPHVIKVGASEPIKVPDAEYAVLVTLKKMGKEAHGPAIARASGGTVSVGAVYKLLGRLKGRGLVQKREELVDSGDIKVKRVLYKAEPLSLVPADAL